MTSPSQATAATQRTAAEDRRLLVIGAASGASIALARLAAAPGPDGVSWLMVLLQTAVLAQGAAAVLWLVRGALRRFVGRVTASHAIREAYALEDTWTYAVFLLTLATALGVQLIAPVRWTLLLLFAVAQLVVLRRALRTRGRHAAREAHGTARAGTYGPAVAAGLASGVAAALTFVSSMRMVERSLGETAALAAGSAFAVWVALALGIVVSARTRVRLGARAAQAAAAAYGALAVWTAVSARFIPSVAELGVTASTLGTSLGIGTIFAPPMLLLGWAMATHALAALSRAVDLERALAAQGAFVLLGAAAGLLLAVNVLFAITGIHGATLIATASYGLACGVTVWLSRRPVDRGGSA